MLKLLTIFFSLFVSANKPVVVGKHPEVKPAVHYQLKTDTVRLVIRQFNAGALKKFSTDPDFNYYTKKAGITWWDRFWNWVWHEWNAFWNWVGEMLEKLFHNASMGKQTANVIKYVILGIFAFALIYIVLKLLGINLLQLLRKKKESGNLPYTEFMENIHEISFDEAIENALSTKNYRLAVRLLYLRSLKQLSDNNLINWKIDKTNSAYLNELTDDEQRRQFSIVTRQFEYVWYGDFPVNGQSFQAINAMFQEFKQRLA